jgi:hypothetical protein
MYSWGSSLILTILGAVMVLASGTFLYTRLTRRKTFQQLKPEHDPRKDDPSGTVVFIILAALVFAIGFLVLGLGFFGLLAPGQTGSSAAARELLPTALPFVHWPA